ncbi:MAG TPA: four helix bundle protein [Terriglobales bacterium]|nr:four helix bundle protein [Terriglobales bacterium]
MNRNYQNLKPYKDGHELAVRVFELTKNFPEEEQGLLAGEIRKAAVKVPAKIAGASVYHGSQLIAAFGRVRGRLFSLEAQLEIARDLYYIGADDAEELLALCERVRRSLNQIIFRLSR